MKCQEWLKKKGWIKRGLENERKKCKGIEKTMGEAKRCRALQNMMGDRKNVRN